MRRPHTIKTLAPLIALAAASAAWSLDLGVTKGVGPDDFRTTGVDAGLDLFNNAVRADAGYYLAESAGSGPDQFTASLRWQAAPRVSGTLSYRHIVDELSAVQGGDFALGVWLAAPWTEAHPTLLTVTYGGQGWQPHASNVAPRLLAAIPQQTHVSTALWQQFTDKWSANLSYDSYSYSKDPIELAVAIVVAARRFRVPATGAYVALGLTDRIASGGLSWQPNARYSASLNYSDIRNVLGQKSSSTAFTLSRTIGRYSLSANLSQSSSDAYTVANGILLFPSSTGAYLDLRLGAHF